LMSLIRVRLGTIVKLVIGKWEHSIDGQDAKGRVEKTSDRAIPWRW
jgi:hypothetical protein